jgi:hypothetical protein
MERSGRFCVRRLRRLATAGVTLREAWGGQPRVAHGAASTAGTPFASEARNRGDRRPVGRHRSGSPAGEARRSANGSHSSPDRGVFWACWLWLASRVSWPCGSCTRKRGISVAAQLVAAYSDRWEEAAVVASSVWGRAFVCDSTAARLLKRRGHCRSRRDAQAPMERYAPGMRILSVDVNFVQNDRRRAHGSGASDRGAVHKLKDSQ